MSRNESCPIPSNNIVVYCTLTYCAGAQNYPTVDIQFLLHLATVIRDNRVHGASKRYTMNNDPPKESPAARIWSPRSFSSDQQSNSKSSKSSDHTDGQDLKARTIDGVQNSDRLDHNLEGTDHRSPMFVPTSTRPLKKGRPSSISGLSLDGLWLRNNGGSRLLTDKGQLSPSSLSVDNFAIGKDARPQTSTWVETFSAFKAKIVGLGSFQTPTSFESEEEDSSKTLVEDPDEIVSVPPPPTNESLGNA